MKKNGILILVFLMIFQLNSHSQTATTLFNLPPEWSKNVIWYQIFVERFYNGDTSNDPKPKNISCGTCGEIPDDWSITPWTHNWYEQEAWAKKTGKKFNETVSKRRYGGDLQGVIDKLDYLSELGITAIYLNPINDAPSLHKYDARNYHHVDVNFGPDPEGDNKLMAQENPMDANTWKWTSADKLFLKLIDEVHKRNMKIILDYSWNHTGVEFWAWRDIVKNQAKSPYKDWYNIKSFDNPATTQNEFDYYGWLNISSLPEIKKVPILTKREIGHPYEGNMINGAKQHIFDVTKRWLAPDGDVSKGIDGYRLDVADHVPMGFWRDYRQFVKSIKSDAYLVGEIWWETWPDYLMNPVPYTSGDVFDGVMFYQAYRPAKYFFSKSDFSIDAQQLKDSLQFQWARLSEPYRYSMMNVSSTHDSPRLLTCFYNSGKYKYKATPNDDPAYKTGKPDLETYQRVKLYLIHQFTNIGSPQIWNGEEMGMWGADDPDCRKPLCWKEFKFEPETRNNYQPGIKTFDPVGFNPEHFNFYKALIQIRKENPVLCSGALEFLKTEGKSLSYKRYNNTDEILVLLNADTQKKDFELPANAEYINLFDRSKVTGSIIGLNPLTGAILKRIRNN